MERCVFCQAEIVAGARFCRACGKIQPSGALPAVSGSASGSLERACPACGQPAEVQDRFCMRCATPLRRPCPECGEEMPIWARFCANCRHIFVPAVAQPEERRERQTLVLLGVPEGVGAPSVPNAPAVPQVGAPGVPGAPAGPQSGAPSVPSAPAGSPAGTAGRLVAHSGGKAIGRSAGSKLLGTAASKVVAAVIAVMVVATGGTAAAVAVGHNPIATVYHQITGNNTAARSVTPPAPPELTYVGSDGNIWDMTLPNGTPRQLTNDAYANADNQYQGIFYSGLAWSPDGQRLAAIRTTQTDTTSSYELLVLSPSGAVLWKQALSEAPLSDSLAWSPDGRFIAYTQTTQNYNYGSSGYDLEGELVIRDTSTGSVSSTLDYDAGPTGMCGGGADALTALMWSAHHAHMGLNTFEWSSDGKKMLIAFNDAGSQSALVVLSNGATTSGYPEGASFQPSGQFILGVGWNNKSGSYDTPLELTDLAGKQVRMLVDSTESGDSPYLNGVGQATWSGDGKAIYYEYQDSIWRINVDGSGARQIIAGTPLVNDQVTMELAPKLSPDGTRLLYLEARGVVDYTGNTEDSVTAQWYVALADGSGAFALPHGTVAPQPNGVEAIWRPVK